MALLKSPPAHNKCFRNKKIRATLTYPCDGRSIRRDMPANNVGLRKFYSNLHPNSRLKP